MILLHGCGSNAKIFAEPLLTTKIPKSNLTFAHSLPTTKFIFATASFRRATFANRTPITQWFDNYTILDADARPEYQIEGLRDSIRHLHGMINEEIKAVKAENVVIGGLSQGACVAILTLLTWDGDSLGGVFGIAGRIPLKHVMTEAMEDSNVDGKRTHAQDDENEWIVFEDESISADNNFDCASPGIKAIRALRYELNLGLSTNAPTVFEIPIFRGHGAEDEVVPISLGNQAVDCLVRLAFDVTWREYKGLGHWYSETQLDEILDFLRDNCHI